MSDFGKKLQPGNRGNDHGFGRMTKRFSNREKPRDMKETLSKLWNYYREEKKILIFLSVVIVLHVISTLFSPFLIGRVIDAVDMKKGMTSQVLRPLLFLLFCYISATVMIWLEGYLIAVPSQRIVKKIRMHLFDRVSRLPVRFFDTRSHGDLMSRFSNDIDNISTTITQTTTELISGFLTVSGSFVMMTVLSPLLTLGTLSVAPVVFLLTRFISRKTRSYYRDQQTALGSLNGLVEETVDGLSLLKAFGQEENLLGQFTTVNSKLYIAGRNAQFFTGLLMPMMNVLNNLSFAVIGLLGGFMVFSGYITVGVIASFINYSRQFVRPLNEIASTWNTLQSAVAGAERVFEIMNETEEIPSVKNRNIPDNAEGRVEFKNVSFSYIPGIPVLKDVSFHVEPGKKIALVGETGSGKTTVVNLLSRFYDDYNGDILLDGVLLQDYNRQSLGNSFGIVLQDSYLFTDTVFNNIAYGKPGASSDDVIEAAELSNAHSFISHLENGYETILTDGGTNLSQGEKQLITIARAVIAKPLILILDEATSSVDTRTEKKIQDAMLKLMSGRTSFIIAHRLSTIKDSDEIYVLENGEIAEKGNHEELMALKHKYYNMVRQQYEKLDIV